MWTQFYWYERNGLESTLKGTLTKQLQIMIIKKVEDAEPSETCVVSVVTDFYAGTE
jgi:uncharacterized protein YcfL